MPDAGLYPATPSARDRFVLDRRGGRVAHDPWRHQGLIVEEERGADGQPGCVATVLLTGRECPWRCAMCDLWRSTTVGDTPRGAIPMQIAAARSELRAKAVSLASMKLYNAGSFFDARAVPEQDYEEIAASLAGLSRVIVESHPALIGGRVDRLLGALGRHRDAGSDPTRLEVAMGLETAHPEALDRLNKRFTIEKFVKAAKSLLARAVSLRVFLLIAPPFVHDAEQDDWLLRSIDASFECGASVISLVPMRSGNGTVEALAAEGWFRPPTLDDIERSLELAVAHAQGRGRVFVDLWDLERFSAGESSFAARRDRLHRINLEQRVNGRS
jgi:archaeosine synthase beta-subunit